MRVTTTTRETPVQPPARGPIAWMAGNPVAANLIMAVLMIGGLLMSARITKEVFPAFEIKTVSVTVKYSGASPEEMEKSVTQVIEQAVEGIEGVKKTTSEISSGMTKVLIELNDDADSTTLLQDVKAEIDRITTFPQEAEAPIVELVSTAREVVTLLLTGSDDMRILRYWADIIRDELAQSPDITQVDLKGIQDVEVHVEIPQDTLRRYNLTLEEVASAIRNTALEQGGGTLKDSSGDVMLRVNERRNYAEEFAAIAVRSNSDGQRLFLDDIATITDGFDDTTRWAEFDGQRAIIIGVFQTGGDSPETVVNAALAIADQFNKTMPGLHLSVQNNRAKTYEQRADLLISNAIVGMSLVFFCLALFLRPLLAFWVSLGIPVSILGAFWFFSPMGMTVNMFSMFAFIVTLGIVVDDAIVVGENVNSWRERGAGPLDAAIYGTREVATSVVFCVLTNIVAFLPMLFIPGPMGKIWGCLPLVVTAVFICSLAECLFVLPAHLASRPHIPKKGFTRLRAVMSRLDAVQQRFDVRFKDFVENRFSSWLDPVLKYRYITLASGCVLLLLTAGYVMSGRMGFDLMPRVESDFAYAEITMPGGAPLSEINRVKSYVVDTARALVDENGGTALSTGIYTQVQDSLISIRVYLVDPDIRPMSTAEFISRWREATGLVPGVENLLMMSDKGGPGSGKGLTLRLSHRDAAVLEKAALALGRELSSYAGVSDIDTGVSQTRRQFDVTLRPVGEQLGFSAREIATQIRNAFEGAIALRQQREQNEVTVRVRLPEEERSRLATFENLILRAPSGEEVLLRDIVEVEDRRADAVIRHTNGSRTMTVSASITPSSATGRMMAMAQEKIMPDLMAEYPGLTWAYDGRQADMQDSTDVMMTGLLLALLGIYALLAIPFKSYTQPLIIMVSIPFGVVGAVAGHFIMGYSLSVISLFGIVALSGVVVNDSLVLISFSNARCREGAPASVAVRQAVLQRFRPIMLTTLTTFAGLMPIMLETSRQARMMIPVALSLGFGILFATVITLFIVPALYLVLDDLHRVVKRHFTEE